MNAKSKYASDSRKSHDRSALIQWIAIGLVAGIGLLAAFVLTDGGGGGGGHSAPAISQTY